MKNIGRLAVMAAILAVLLSFQPIEAQQPGAIVAANLAVTGTLAVGPFTTASPIRQITVYTPSLTPVATAAAIGTTQQTFTVTGLATTDAVAIQGPVPTSLCPMIGGRVSAADTLQLNFTTLTAVACTPVAGTYTVYAYRAGAP